MAAIKKIEERTKQFIDYHAILKKRNEMVTHDELAKIIGVESKTTISEILGKRQNIQPDQWEAFRKYFKIGSDFPVQESKSADNSKTDAIFIEFKTASGKTIHVMPEGQTEITLLNALLEERSKIIDNLQTDKQKLQSTIDTNLTALMTLLAALSRHDRSFHETILKSLSRLEGGNIDLIGEARSYEAAMQTEEFLAGSKSQAGNLRS